MRPKKRIAVWGADADRAGVIGFVLRTQGWNVLSREVAKRPATRLNAALVLCDGTQADAEKWARQARSAAGQCVVAILAPKITPPEAAAISLSDTTPNFDLLERLAIITARKRGPKKGWKAENGPDISEISTGFIHRAPRTVQKRG